MIIDGSTQSANGYTGKLPKIQIGGYNFGEEVGSIGANTSYLTGYALIQGLELKHFGFYIQYSDNSIFRNNVFSTYPGTINGVPGINASFSNNCIIQGNIFCVLYDGEDLLINDGVNLVSFMGLGHGSSNFIIGGDNDNLRNIFSASLNSITVAGSSSDLSNGNLITRNLIHTDLPSYSLSGIELTNNYANIGKPAPIINQYYEGVLSGTADPNDKVEIFVSVDENTSLKYLETINVNASGNWSLALSGIPNGYGLIATATDINNNTSEFSNYIEEIFYIPPISLCNTSIPENDNGGFTLDTFSGAIVYQREESCAEDIDMICIEGPATPPIIEQVISASATTLGDDWEYSSYHNDRYASTLPSNEYEDGTKGKWRSVSNNTYQTSDINRAKNYNTGTYDVDLFSWKKPNANKKDKWVPVSNIEKYSPHGEALQERNALDIASTVKMGYYDALPYLTAQNAMYESVFFESFEMSYNGQLESGASLISAPVTDIATAHAGVKSLTLTSGKGFKTPTMQVTAANTVMMMQVWVQGNPGTQLTMYLSNVDDTADLSSLAMTQISRSGDWGLYQGLLNTGSATSFIAKMKYNGAGTIWVDDARVQPMDSEMTCYVYDPATLRLLTVFDGQHFGLYYQYNGEGKLVRKMIETERGIRTIQETFYNTPTVNK